MGSIFSIQANCRSDVQALIPADSLRASVRASDDISRAARLPDALQRVRGGCDVFEQTAHTAIPSGARIVALRGCVLDRQSERHHARAAGALKIWATPCGQKFFGDVYRHIRMGEFICDAPRKPTTAEIVSAHGDPCNGFQTCAMSAIERRNVKAVLALNSEDIVCAMLDALDVLSPRDNYAWRESMARDIVAKIERAHGTKAVGALQIPIMVYRSRSRRPVEAFDRKPDTTNVLLEIRGRPYKVRTVGGERGVFKPDARFSVASIIHASDGMYVRMKEEGGAD